jgi:O6-methylguanine-DNA--protein-cysteine methyltransferase
MADRGETAAWVVPAGVLGAIRVTCGPAGVTALTFLAEAAEAPDPAAQRDFARAHPWAVALLDGLRDYLAGRPVDFAEIPVDLSGQTPFRRRVQEACRRIPYGRTSSYAELAVAVGQPAAARCGTTRSR